MAGAEVECYAGTQYPERPRAFRWGGEQVRVRSIERQWRMPTSLVFRVQAEDCRCFILTYCEARDEWDVRQAGVPSQAK